MKLEFTKIPLFNISGVTIIYSAYIVISAAFMRQVLNFLQARLDPSSLDVFVWLLFAMALLPVIYWTKKYLINGKRYLNVLLLVVVSGLGFYYASTFEVAEERYHLVLFGLLGFLIAGDNDQKPMWFLFVMSLCFCVLVASCDEVFQYFLPYRVGDVRDVLFGAVGGMWGILIHLSMAGARLDCAVAQEK